MKDLSKPESASAAGKEVSSEPENGSDVQSAPTEKEMREAMRNHLLNEIKHLDKLMAEAQDVVGALISAKQGALGRIQELKDPPVEITAVANYGQFCQMLRSLHHPESLYVSRGDYERLRLLTPQRQHMMDETGEVIQVLWTAVRCRSFEHPRPKTVDLSHAEVILF